MLAATSKFAVALVVTVLALAVILGLQFVSEIWLGLVIFLEAYVGSGFAGAIGLALVTPITFVLLYGIKDPRT